jgi:trans-o-hydroxybenzylidenepyruvate hydratase-aldolase
MLSVQDIKGLYAIIPTPAKPDANQLDATHTVDLDETARLVKALIDDGVDAIVTTGTTGECATITDGEFRDLVACVSQTVGRRVPLLIGSTALGGHAIVERLKFVREAGADGALLGLPMWQPCTLGMAHKFYREVAEMFPDLAFMVYANSRAFRFGFPQEFWAAMASEVPNVVAAKYSRVTGLKEVVAATNKRINFMPVVSSAPKFYELSPETTTACWATMACCGPAPSVAMATALRARDEQRVRTIGADMSWAGEPLRPISSNAEIFASYNIQLEKIRMEAAGYCRPGPLRPPYDVVPPEYDQAARECGRRWGELHHRYSN